MSFRVLVIPEDFTQDQYILKPIVEAMFAHLGRKATVDVCQSPKLGSVEQALRWDRLRAIIDRNRAMYQCILLVVDRDGIPGRRDQLDRLEELARQDFPDRIFLAENAWQEIEVWCLAGLDLAGVSWAELRQERDPKERYFEPFARGRAVFGHPGQGRKLLSQEAARRYDRIRRLCPEDVESLESRLAVRLGTP